MLWRLYESRGGHKRLCHRVDKQYDDSIEWSRARALDRERIASRRCVVRLGSVAFGEASSHERLNTPLLSEMTVLIKDSTVPGDDASPALGLRLQRFDRGKCVDRIAENDWAVKFPLEDSQKCEGIDARRLADQSGGDRQTEQSMSNGPTEGIALYGRMIDVKWVKISREPGEEDNIGFRHRPSGAFPLIADHEIIK
jgi:hypothetical protein